MSTRSKAQQQKKWKLYLYRTVIISIVVIMMFLSILQF